MNRKLLVVFVAATVLAACIGYLVYRALGAHDTPAPSAAMADVVMATHNIDVGKLIASPDVRLAKWPGTAPKGSLNKMDQVLNHAVLYPIFEGEPVLATRLASAGSGAGLASMITPGMRACAVKVDDVVGVSGFVTPGMRVDVLVTGVPPGNTNDGGPRVRTLMQNIQVISAGANLQRDTEGKAQSVQVVNLLVTPQQAETLSLASSQTRIQLVLRNPIDNSIGVLPGAELSQVFGSASRPVDLGAELRPRPTPPRSFDPFRIAPPTKPVPPASRLIEVLNGTTRSEVRFARPEDQK